jgi:myo-inositol-1(or 4)-monophosphatase
MSNLMHVAELAARAGGHQLRTWRRQFKVSEKGRFDLVTDADHASQAAIRDIILDQFPDHHFLGEETPLEERTELLKSDRPLWLVDPLDGTTNYVHDLPCYAVSIGLLLEGNMHLGVIYDPTRDELFTACQGDGAFVNGERLRCSPAMQLTEALIAVGFPANLRGQDHVLEAWKWFGIESQGMRRTGSSAINLAYLAAGRLDGFFAFQIAPWDIAAGIIIVEEAGGKVTQADGSPYPTLGEAVFVASNGPLHQPILEGLAASKGSA